MRHNHGFVALSFLILLTSGPTHAQQSYQSNPPMTGNRAPGDPSMGFRIGTAKRRQAPALERIQFGTQPSPATPNLQNRRLEVPYDGRFTGRMECPQSVSGQPRVITKPPKQITNPKDEWPSADEGARPRVIAKPPVADDYPRVIAKPPKQITNPKDECPST
ncbi:MAG: hypothetical protein K2W95_22130, partial [Candidatus Obscuribacterales bacterium]|nr:hypothetical protein [Candidatus Obscuribacterales bacterium]